MRTPLLSLIALALAALSVQQSPSLMEPTIQAAECLAAINAADDRSPMGEAAKRFFERRVRAVENDELRELLVISAEESILRNANRREIASTCVLLYQVLKLQEERSAEGA